MLQTRVLLVGNPSWVDALVAFQRLNEQVEVTETDDIQAACRLILESQFDLIVVAQQRPGQFAPKGFEILRAAAPLTPIVSLLGNYCEGEARTGRPWPGAVRVYIHQFVARVSVQLERFRSGGAMNWTPPYTSTDEDRYLAAQPPQLGLQCKKRVAVFSQNNQTASALCDALMAEGNVVVEGLKSGDAFCGIDVVLWDCDSAFAACQSRFMRIIEQAPQAAKIVLLGFPRSLDVAKALASGATAVVSKPFLLDDLLWQLQHA